MSRRLRIYELLGFKVDTAGGIVSTDYLALGSKMTAAEALSRHRHQYADLEEDIDNIYVVDEQDHLVGSLTIKDLLTADLSAHVSDLMKSNVVKVHTATDQEEAVKAWLKAFLMHLARACPGFWQR